MQWLQRRLPHHQAYEAADWPSPGDSDVFSFDANTGRMTQYKFNIGVTPQSVVGNLTWNANGTLNKLIITDPFDSANNQTCNYVHDDLVRISSANCGAAASQNFSYDVFGNLNKQGSPGTFNASYNSATNRITGTCGSSTGFSSDANGNMTGDGSNTLVYDAENRNVTATNAAPPAPTPTTATISASKKSPALRPPFTFSPAPKSSPNTSMAPPPLLPLASTSIPVALYSPR